VLIADVSSGPRAPMQCTAVTVAEKRDIADAFAYQEKVEGLVKRFGWWRATPLEHSANIMGLLLALAHCTYDAAEGHATG
jgi:hypothetical protein